LDDIVSITQSDPVRGKRIIAEYMSNKSTSSLSNFARSTQRGLELNRPQVFKLESPVLDESTGLKRLILGSKPQLKPIITVSDLSSNSPKSQFTPSLLINKDVN
jgi:hypothetical protein